MANLIMNVGPQERIASVVGGAFLLYDTIAKRKTNMIQAIAGSYLLLRGLTGFCLAYDRLGKKEIGYKPRNVNIRTSMTVNRPRDQVYAFWRRLENLPLFMRHLSHVEVLDHTHSEWTAVIAGETAAISWKSEIVKDDPGDTLSWRSLPDSMIRNAGKITFRDAENGGTKVNVVFSYHAPLGLVGEKAGRLLNPMFENMVKTDILSFKDYIESVGAASGESVDRDKSKKPESLL